MAELLLKLVRDPQTGERSVVVDYRSDGDALPMEHEDEHRNLVDKVFDGEGADARSNLPLEREAEAAPQSDSTGGEQDVPQGIDNKA